MYSHKPKACTNQENYKKYSVLFILNEISKSVRTKKTGRCSQHHFVVKLQIPNKMEFSLNVKNTRIKEM